MSYSKIRCHYPWTSLYVSPNGDVKHCCATNLSKLGNLSNQTVEEIWNGTLFKTVRRKISKGDYEGAYCNSNCEGLRTGEGYPWPQKVEGSKNIEENETKAKKNFENNQEIVDHFPLFLQMEFSDNCNFRCVMCYYEFKPPYSFIPENAVDKLLDISKYATTLSLMGGEVFMNKRDLDFIDKYTPQEGAFMGFITNASYLDDMMIERIKKFKRMWMQISIDGTEKHVFEKVRRRGQWEIVDANIHRVVKVSKELQVTGYDWNINLAYVVMASNFANLAHAINYAIELGIFIAFNPIKGFHLFKENIFVYKDAINAIGNWQTQLDNAYEVLEKNKNNYKFHDNVLKKLGDIEKQLQNPKINVPNIVVKLLKNILPGKVVKNEQGLSKNDRYVGHLIEVYYNWRIGKTSLWTTISYVFMKLNKRIIKNRNK